MSHLALKTELTPRQRDYVKKIQGSSQYLLRIINDILDFSKIEAGKLAIERIEFDLEKTLENVAGLLAEKTTAKGLELVFDVGPDVPDHLIGDPLRLSQILLNYANNAVKFTETGEIGRDRAPARDHGDGVSSRCRQDSGIGLTEEQRDRLFQLQQADTSTTRNTGARARAGHLGLASDGRHGRGGERGSARAAPSGSPPISAGARVRRPSPSPPT
jgi:signal transduction histidine kinase